MVNGAFYLIIMVRFYLIIMVRFILILNGDAFYLIITMCFI
ncbi:putative membrane protein [Helicobacter pylori R055a]|nr:putative membrane protein [Helicobacter pylori R055a]